MMPRCASCKHWDQRQQLENLARFDQLVAEGFWLVQNRSRKHEEEEAEFGDCAKLHDSELLKNQEHVDQWWDTPRQTHQTFGCVLWEPREEEH